MLHGTRTVQLVLVCGCAVMDSYVEWRAQMESEFTSGIKVTESCTEDTPKMQMRRRLQSASLLPL